MNTNLENSKTMSESTLIPFPEVDEKKPLKVLPSKKEGLYDICKPIAQSPNILEILEKSLQESGVVGEMKICKLLYLALTTRIFDRPVSVAVKGPSAGGKSFLVEKVLGFFPGSAYYFLSSMSSKALIYTEENFKHRFILFAEADGITKDAEYYIRTLLSENCIKHEVVEQNENGEFHTRLIEKEGPTGIILTTTRTSLHPENETRIISVTVIDTKEQSQAVLIKIAEDDDFDVDTSGWMAFQEWIAMDPPEVRIPYARKLASLTKADALRIKRDFKALTSLIKAHALIHQMNREKNDNGDIIATLEDYEQVREIVGLFIAEAVECSVSPTIRETVNAVKILLKEKDQKENGLFSESEGYCVKLTAIAQELEIEKSPAGRRVKVACEAGYLENLESRPGRSAKVRLGNPLPEEQDVFPSVDKLRE